MMMSSILDTMVSWVMNGYETIQATSAGAIALLVVGLLCCFLGYRLARWVCGLIGAAIGGALCAFVAASYLPSALSDMGALLAGVVGALLVGYLFFHLYHVMVFVVCASFGALLGSVPAIAVGLGPNDSDSMMFFVILAACAVLFGVAGVLFLKPVMIILTGLGGFLAAPQILMLTGMTNSTTMQLLVGAVLSAAGIVVQFVTNRRRTSPGFRRQPAKPEGEEGAVNDSTIPSDGAAEETAFATKQKKRREKKKKPAGPVIENPLLRGLVGISPILLLIAVCLTVVCQTEHFELVLLVALLCYRGRQYKPMLCAFAVMLLYCGYMTYAQWNLSDLPATGFDVVGCAVFAILMIVTLVGALRPVPERVSQEYEPDEEATVILTDYEEELDATRPLTQKDREEAEETAEGITMRTIPVEDPEPAEEDTQVFAAGAPQEFRETQQEIFDADASAAETEAGMEAEPDDLDGTRML